MNATTDEETLERLGRLAAEGWWLVREPAPRAARHPNATLQYLTVHPSQSDT